MRRSVRAILVGPVLSRRSSGLKRALAGLRYRSAAGDFVVAVDGGANHLIGAGIVPDLSIGDWDSLSPKLRARVLSGRHLSLSPDKDRSDLYYAAALAAEAGANEIVCFGVAGGRPDHHLAALLDLAEVASRSKGVRSIRVLAPDAEYVFVGPGAEPHRLGFSRGTLVSIFSPLGMSRGVTLRGFEYPLREATLAPSSRGLSNRVVRARCEVRVRKGTLLLVIPSRMA